MAVYFMMIDMRSGFSCMWSVQREKTLFLAGRRSLHSVRIWERVPGVGFSLQVGREQK